MLRNMAEKFLIIAALHGDEELGVEVMEKIEKEFLPEKYSYDWIIGNPEAYKKKVRFIEADLNRVAPGDLKSSIYEERRAAEIIALSQKYSFVLDLHATVANSGIVTLITYPTLQNFFLASMINTRRSIVWYSSSSSVKGPISQFTKCPAIEIECGPQKSNKTKDELLKILKEFILKNFETKVGRILKQIKSKQFYVIYGKMIGEHNSRIKDFKPYKNNKESFYPFLANQYDGIVCYKAKKFDFRKILSYSPKDEKA